MYGFTTQLAYRLLKLNVQLLCWQDMPVWFWIEITNYEADLNSSSDDEIAIEKSMDEMPDRG